MLATAVLNLKKWLRRRSAPQCNQPQTDKPHANKLSKKVPDPERNAMSKYPSQGTPVYVIILSSLTVLRTLILLVSHPHRHPQSNTIRRMGEETRVLSLKPARGHHPSPIPHIWGLLTPLPNSLRRCLSPHHIPRQCRIRRKCHIHRQCHIRHQCHIHHQCHIRRLCHTQCQCRIRHLCRIRLCSLLPHMASEMCL
jgi:hypothetical protein